MKKMRFLSAVMTLVLIVGVLSPTAGATANAAVGTEANTAAAPGVKSAAIYVADADTGYVYYDRNADTRVYPASLTKIMTAMLAVEAVERGEVSLDDMVTAQPGYDFDMVEDGSTSSIVEGETMSLKNLLYCTLLASANEACNIVAMYICGDVSTFVDRMNQRAEELGCTGTHFANTHGLPNDNHYTTAHDMYRIAHQAMTYDTFAAICDTAEYTIPETNMNSVRALSNTNGLINSASIYQGFYYEPAVGIKTGYTSAAGFCLISSAEKDGVHLFCIVMGGVMTENANGSMDYSNYTDSISLYDWVFDNYSRQELVAADELVTEIGVTLGSDADTLPLRVKEPISAVISNDADLSQLEKKVTIYSEDGTCQAPIQEGQVLGELTVSLDGVEYGTTYLVANRSVDLSYLQSMGATIKNTLHNTWVRLALLVILLIVVVYLVLVVRYRVTYRKRQKELREARLQRQRMQEKAERDRVFAEAKRQSYRARQSGHTPPDSDVTRDYFEEFFRDEDQDPSTRGRRN